MTQKTHSIVITLLAALAAHCAKERPIEKVKDHEGNRWQKSVFSDQNLWLAKVTIVEAGSQSPFAFAGLQSPMRAGYFEFTKDRLRFINAHPTLDRSVKTDINSWAITHSEYTLQEVNGRKTNIETENNDISWENKSHFKIQWETASVTEDLSFPGMISSNTCWSKVRSSPVEGSQEVGSEHISFTLAVEYQINDQCADMRRYNNANLTNIVHYKYSFIPMPKTGYSPYLYTGEADPLMQKYGYFNTVVETRKENGLALNRFVMNRWNPNKTHVYYFAENFPNQFKAMFADPETGIFAETNKIFIKHGLPTRFEIRENDGTKKFGDSRYSFVRLVTDLDGAAPLGYGPTDVNPFTGEIVAGNLILWTGSLKYYIEILQDRVKNSDEKLENSPIYREIKNYLGPTASWTQTSDLIHPSTEAGRQFLFYLPEYTYGSPYFNAFARHERQPLFSPIPIEKILQNLPEVSQINSELPRALASAHEQSKKYLETTMAPQFPSPHNSNIFQLDKALVEARALAIKGFEPQEIIERIVYRTAIHEFGHNLNLRHNFYGSVDHLNFHKASFDGKGREIQPVSSSVMDYISLTDDLKFERGFGAYDEAALAFAYSDGKRDLAKEKGTNFLYCTDEHVPTNALCNRWDSGTTPSKIVRSLIDDYELGYWTQNFRYGRAYWYLDNYSAARFAQMWDFKKFLKFHEQTYDLSELDAKLATVRALQPGEGATIGAAIRRDMKQAALLSAAFLGAVAKQQPGERPFHDQYDSWTGALERKGIAEDKIWAIRFLLGNDSFDYNPNRGQTPASYIGLSFDQDIGQTMGKILESSVLDPGPMYFGFSSYARVLYALNAAYYRDADGDGLAIERLKVSCYRPETFQTMFNIPDVLRFSQNGEEPQELLAGTLTLNLNKAKADPYFLSSQKAAVLKIGGNYYVASEQKNPYAFNLIAKKIGYEVLQMFVIYSQMTEGKIPECR